MRIVRIAIVLTIAASSSACGSNDPEPHLGTIASRINADTTPGDLGLPSRLAIPAPALDIAALHHRWKRELHHNHPCTWRTYQVGERDGVTLREALVDAHHDRSICGPVISLTAGRYEETPLTITKPTIIIGGDGVVLSSTIVSTAGAPLWLQDVTIENAPFPGAIFASHPSAETTLVRVRILNATGFGLLHDGGVLAVYDSVMRGTKEGSREDRDPRIPRRRLAEGLGQPPSTDGPFRHTSFPAAFASLEDLIVSDVPPRIRPSYARMIRSSHDIASYSAVDPIGFVDDQCSGVGTLVYNASSYFSATLWTYNDRAGLVVSKGTTEEINSAAGLNGQAVDDTSGGVALAAGFSCFGGIQITDAGKLFGEGGGALYNAPVGLIGRANTEVVFGTWTTNHTSSPSGVWGDNLYMTTDSFFSVKAIETRQAQRAGLLFDGMTANLYGGHSTDNAIGIGTLNCPNVYLGPSFSNVGNVENVIADACWVNPEGPSHAPH